MSAEESVFQIDLGLSNEVISREPIPVHDRNGEGVVERESGRKLKHFTKNRIETARDVALFVVNHFLPKFDLDVRIRLTI